MSKFWKRVRRSAKGTTTATVVGSTAFAMLAAFGASVAIRHTPAAGADPCTSFNTTTSGFPCESTDSTGVPTGTVLKTALTSGTGACTGTTDTVDRAHCPVGLTWTAGGGFRIAACPTVIDGWDIPGGLSAYKSNGFTDGTPAHACTTLLRSKIHGQVDTRFTTATTCSPAPCGPVYYDQVEVAVPQPNAGNFTAIAQTNQWVHRSYVHGTRTAMQCDGHCGAWDSYLVADYFKTPSHMDAYISNSNVTSDPIVMNHDTFWCVIGPGSDTVTPGTGCTADAAMIGDFSPGVSNQIWTNNLFMETNDSNFCAYTGAHHPGKPFPESSNVNWSGNVFEKGISGHCSDGSAISDPDPDNDADSNTPAVNAKGNVFCNNKFDDGTFVLKASETC